MVQIRKIQHTIEEFTAIHDYTVVCSILLLTQRLNNGESFNFMGANVHEFWFFFAYSFFSFNRNTKSFIISFRRGCKFMDTNIMKIKSQQILMIPKNILPVLQCQSLASVNLFEICYSINFSVNISKNWYQLEKILQSSINSLPFHS